MSGKQNGAPLPGRCSNEEVLPESRRSFVFRSSTCQSHHPTRRFRCPQFRQCTFPSKRIPSIIYIARSSSKSQLQHNRSHVTCSSGREPAGPVFDDKMQSSKTIIKGTIRYLCSLLAGLGVSSLTPEAIRQAKFDSPGLVRRLCFVFSSHTCMLLMCVRTFHTSKLRRLSSGTLSTTSSSCTQPTFRSWHVHLNCINGFIYGLHHHLLSFYSLQENPAQVLAPLLLEDDDDSLAEGASERNTSFFLVCCCVRQPTSRGTD